MKKLASLTISALFFLSLTASAFAGGQGQLQGQGQGQQQGQGQGQQQGQGQGQQQGQVGINHQGQAQGQIGINDSDNTNNATASSDATGGEATGTGVGTSLSDATGTGVGTGAAQNAVTNDYSSDDLTLYLPDPVDINLPQNTQPGISLSCSHLASHIDYTGGDSTGVSIWVLGFANSNTPDEIPENSVVDAVVACGLSEQLLSVARSSMDLDAEVVEEVEYQVLQKLLHHLFMTVDEEYKDYMLPLGAFNRQVDDMMVVE